MNPHFRLQVFREAHWMLLGLVLCLAATFGLAGHWFGKKIEDTYHDPRRMAALKTFERAIHLAQPGEADIPVTAEALKERFPCLGDEPGIRLSGQFLAIQAQLRSLARGSGKSLRLSLEPWPSAGADCQAAVEAVAWLAQGGRLENSMDWPGLRKERYETVMRVPETVFKQDNPWRGADGCVYLGPTAEGRLYYLAEQRSHSETCPAMAPTEFGKDKIQGIARPPGKPNERYALAGKDPAWAIPEDLGAILAGLNPIRRPEGLLYQDYTATNAPPLDAAAETPTTHGPNQLRLKKRDIDMGFNVHLTLVPALQSLVQPWTRCYAGDRHACEVAGLDGKDPMMTLAREMYEAAAVRMAAVALIDVASGRIEALGSAHTDCYQQDHDGPDHASDCPDAPFRPRYDPDRLLNHAIYVDAMPASTVKPIMALGFMMDNPAYRSGEPLRQLQDDLKHSRSAEFLDRLFCGQDPSGQRPWQWRECPRPRRVQEAAIELGWDLGCTAEQFSVDCGRLDLLFGRPAGKRLVEGIRRQPMGLAMLYGRLYTEPYDRSTAAANASATEWDVLPQEEVGGARLMFEFRFDESFARSCSSGQGEGRWRRCKGVGGLIANEGWGQGEARATTVGVAGMLARLAAAANGMKEQKFPHLVDHISDVLGKPFPLPLERLAGPAAVDADGTLAALILRGMASHTAGGTANKACERVFGKGTGCDGIDWIAGKTGTPPFGLDRTPLSQVRRTCAPDRAKARTEFCNVLPYKWYVAAFKTRGEAGAPYDKAIAVLTERNWRRKTQLVQAPGDSEVNLSAELAFRIIKILHQAPATAPPKPNAPKKTP